MKSEKELLDVLQEEEEKVVSEREALEKAAVAREKTALEHIAGIIAERNSRITLRDCTGDNIESALAAQFFTEKPLPVDGQDDCLSRALLAEAAASATGRSYEPGAGGLKQLAVQIAADVYHDIFMTVFPAIKVPEKTPEKENKSRQDKDGEKEPSGTVPEVYTKSVNDYLTPAIAVLAAAHFLKLISGFEAAVMQSREPEDLCYIAATKVYYEIMPTGSGKEAIMAEAGNPACMPKSLFLYSVMLIHREFFNHFET